MRKHFFLVFLVFVIHNGFSQQNKALVFREEVFNFGDVIESEGAVVHAFEFTNTTSRPIAIVNVQPSCGCTTPDWSKEPILPGKIGFVKASFDPAGRPGYFDKSLTITTDLAGAPVQLRIKGQVVSGVVSKDDFSKRNGNMGLESSSFNMGKVFLKDEYMVKEFAWKNVSNKPIEITKVISPAFIRVELIPTVVNAGEAGAIRLNYNGSKKNSYGFQSDNIELHTTDPLNPTKNISVFATLEEFFPPLSAEESAKAPRLQILEKTFDLGRIKSGSAATKSVTISNVGKQPLVIRAVQSNCTCIVATANVTTLKTGASSTISIVFNPEERIGTQQKSIMVYSNDPNNPVQRIIFSAYVEN